MSSYEPAVCNIGRPQRRRRLAYAGGGFGAAAAYLLGYAGGVVPGELLVGMFVPLAVGFEWGLQAYTAVCVRLALTGRYDFRGAVPEESGDHDHQPTGDGGRTGRVTDPEARRADQVEAAKITAAALVLAAAATAGVVAAAP